MSRYFVFCWLLQAFFNAPDGNEPLALDMSSMGKGQVWINGQSIGRYWPGYMAYGSCGDCDYRGTYDEKKCQTNCGEPSQKWQVHLHLEQVDPAAVRDSNP